MAEYLAAYLLNQSKRKNMINTFTTMKRTGMILLASFLFSTTVSAQKKSVYDVVPGSGPKKKNDGKTVYDVTKNKTYDKTGTVYYPSRRKKRLPPGQAKKIYGGSAKDYAPGQMKKHKKWHHKHKYKKHHKHEDRDKHEDRENKHGDRD